MSDKSRLAWRNTIDDPTCTLTCTASEILPVSNLRNTSRDHMRISSGSSFMLKGTHSGLAIAVRMFGLARSNLTIGAAAEYKLYANDDWTGANTLTITKDPAIVALTLEEQEPFGTMPIGGSVWKPYSEISTVTGWRDEDDTGSYVGKSWTLEIDDIGNPDGYIDAARLFVANYREMTYNPRYGLYLDVIDDSEQWKTGGAGMRVDAEEKYRVIACDIENIPDDDRDWWVDVQQYCGLSKDFIFAGYPNGTARQIRDYTINGMFDKRVPRLTSAFYGRDTTQIVMREL